MFLCSSGFTHVNKNEDVYTQSAVKALNPSNVKQILFSGSNRKWTETVKLQNYEPAADSCVNIAAGPSPQARLWGAPAQRKRRSSSLREKLHNKPTELGLQETIAESVYISRPLVHRILLSQSIAAQHICQRSPFMLNVSRRWGEVSWLSPVFLNAACSALPRCLWETVVEAVARLRSPRTVQVRKLTDTHWIFHLQDKLYFIVL